MCLTSLHVRGISQYHRRRRWRWRRIPPYIALLMHQSDALLMN